MSVEAAREVVRRCRMLAACSDEPGCTTRTFLSESMRKVHGMMAVWMTAAGMEVRVDPAGNLRGVYAGASRDARRLLVGSHLDTVPHAGAFDGVLGVVMGLSLVESLHGRRLPYGRWPRSDDKLQYIRTASTLTRGRVRLPNPSHAPNGS